jgi:hypothetical protein
MSTVEYRANKAIVLCGASRWAWPCVAIVAIVIACRSCDVAVLRACNAYVQAEQNRTLNVNLGRASK